MKDLNNFETELRFFAKGKDWKELASKTSEIWQAYISSDYRRVVRVRIQDEKSYLTIKGEKVGDSNLEMEYSIPKQDVLKMLKHPNLVEGTPIHKLRSFISTSNIDWKGEPLVWEVDEFLDHNAPLQIAEIELKGPVNRQELEYLKQEVLSNLPRWIGKRLDFSQDSNAQKFFGNQLSKKPFESWPEEEQLETLNYLGLRAEQ